MSTKPTDNKKAKAKGRPARLAERVTAFAMRLWNYWTDGIWADNRQKWWVNLLKTLNICVKSFTDTDLQTQACAMTYRTILAIVPALALLLAIGRGFGFNDFISQELFQIFPGQEQAIAEEAASLEQENTEVILDEDDPLEEDDADGQQDAPEDGDEKLEEPSSEE